MRNIEPGFHVFGSDGVEIGTVANCSREFCEVNTGVLGLGQPIYVPMDAVTQTEGNNIYLNVSSERVGELNWSERPTGGSESCATTYAGTMPTQPSERATATGEATPSGAPSASELSPAAIMSVGRGWPVICSEGKHVGNVVASRPDGLVMERGWFIFRHEVLVPARTIERIDDVGHRVYLGVDCAAVNRFQSV